MHAEHAALLAEIKRLARPPSPHHHHNDSYLGSGHVFHRVSVPERRAIAKAWLAAHRSANGADVLALVESLIEGKSHEEKTLACLILAGHAAAKRATRPKDVERWLGHLSGWAEVDSLCQNLFKVEDLLADWPGWKTLIERLSASANINKRRASLVLLTGPTRYSDDARFRDLAFALIDKAMGEKDIMITKAVSWLLRSMTTRHRDAVAAYVEANAVRLPAIAVRETRTKLRTGKKNG